MTEPKFTPGPWYQGGGDYRHDVFDRKASRNPDGIREGETPNLIITVTSENVDADVKLIAAAPDLFNALLVAEESVGDLESLEIVRAALGKARGERHE